ncbi:enoyl-CoA hydratase-related protein [Cysteiniphilum sp. 6C5]|uniref:enoyl-CoA hydratase-related protein n=1 Tax=unclassified Cysteiniphilum TaxID=2610889 RepID=UPI003F87612E
MDKILCQHGDKITTITINNSDKRNAFDSEMSKAVTQSIHEAQRKKQRVIVLKANISHGIFSAGHDLNELTSVDEITNDPMFEMFDAMTASPLPIIAQVEGAVYAGALHMLMVCDMVYATNDSKVIITANKMGVPFSLRNYQNWLSVMSIHKAKELFFTASSIDAMDAYHAGIFNTVFSDKAALKARIDEVCQAIISCCAEGVANSKLQLNVLANDVTINYDEAVLIEESRHKILNSPQFTKRVEALIAKIHHKN